MQDLKTPRVWSKEEQKNLEHCSGDWPWRKVLSQGNIGMCSIKSLQQTLDQ